MHFLSRLGARYPLIQAPMAGVQGSAMAIAVSSVGALGSLPCAMLSTNGLRDELLALQALGSKPYNLNFFCHQQPDPHAPSHVERAKHWQLALSPYYWELGLDPQTITPGAGRMPFTAAIADLIEPFKPPVVSFHFGLPDPTLLARVKSWGSLILGCATTVAEARWLESSGVDAVIAQGVEAGGHRGIFLPESLSGNWALDLCTQVGTMALLPQVVQAVRCPVIAAGGIADAQGVAAAMRLGAAAVQVGTTYMLCDEASTSALHRDAIKKEANNLLPTSTLTTLFTGRPARGLMNRAMRELGPLNPQAPVFPLATAAIAPLRAQAEARGLSDFSPLWSGQNTRGCREIGASAMTTELAKGFAL